MQELKKLKVSMVMLMAMLLLVAGCTGPQRLQPRQESQGKSESTTPVRTGPSVVLNRNSVDSKDEAITAVYEHLSARSLNPRAQEYLQDYLNWVGWPDEVRVDRDTANQLTYWYVMVEHLRVLSKLSPKERAIYEAWCEAGNMSLVFNDTVRFGTPERPYWSSAAWLVLPNGDVEAHHRHSGNAFLVEWDLILLSAGYELPEGRWLTDIEPSRD